MEFKKFSKETAAELLAYLADHQTFDAVKGLKEITKSDINNLLREISTQLKEMAALEPLIKKECIKKQDLTDNLYKVISNLTPNEETLLLKSFKIN